MKTSLRRSAAALVTAGALLVAMMSPAAAVVENSTITGGTVLFTKTGVPSRTFPLAGGAPCPDPTVTWDVTSSPDNIDVDVFSHKSLIDFTGGGTNTHILEIKLHPTQVGSYGIYDHTTGIIYSSTIKIVFELYQIDTEATCKRSGLVCKLGTTLHLSSINFTSHSSSTTFIVNSANLAPLALMGVCGAPMNVYTAGDAVLNGLQVHMT